MTSDQSSISIINKNNGKVTGESSGALPIRLIGTSWIKVFIAGCVLTGIIAIAIFQTAMKQVVVVEVSGKSKSFQILEIK